MSWRGIAHCRSLQAQVKNFWLFGLCYAMDGSYKGWNPYIERHLAIFVNCFFLERTNQLVILKEY
ncbi:MAG: hypothetical protein EWV66_00710 [Microcystis sp. M_OC_Ca_00000000_C217Col]|nr:MAG: hypothetical protein EWV66_00710 [Microcystis sp. M_OC_Ca_00000000_C217Col]